MKASIAPTEAIPLQRIDSGPIDELLKTILFRLLEGLERGRLTVLENGASHTFGHFDRAFPLSVTVTIHHPRFYRHAVFGGSIGAAEAYMAGYWSSNNLTDVIRLIVLNHQVMDKMETGWGLLMGPFHKYFHWLRRNTKEGSRLNIAAHYDLGNNFYALFLDQTLTYSCAIFENEETTLEQASIAKYDRICKKLQLKGSDHVLEIGTGWGGFAIHASRAYGCQVTTTTISRQQYDLATKRIQDARLEDRVTVLLHDYRDLKGQYDKLVSIEMIEAVGHQYLETFFRKCSQNLKEDGMMLLQAITVADQVFDRHKTAVDFIKRYVFPGSCIPSLTAISQAVAWATDLRIIHLEDLTPHYARTLREWRKRFFLNIEQVRALGYSEAFIRMWEYYLCYCEGGFAERYLGNLQILFSKPLCRPSSKLPPVVT
jgi:cyclopropane-fatty-acyl-phospholipid synthase